MRKIEDTFKITDFLKPKVKNRYRLGTKEELKEMFVKAFIYYDRTIDEYNHKPEYDNIIGTESIKNDYGTKIDAVADAISYAEDSSKTLLVTTNLTPKALDDRYSDRTLDRLRKCKVVVIKGNSFRK